MGLAVYNMNLAKKEHPKEIGALKSTLNQFGQSATGMISSVGGAIESKGRTMQDIEYYSKPEDKFAEVVGKGLEKVGGFVKTPYQEMSDKFGEGVNQKYATFRGEDGRLDPMKFASPANYLHAIASGAGSYALPLIAAALTKGKGGPAAAGIMGGLAEKGDAVSSYSESVAKERGVSVDQLSKEDLTNIDKMSDVYLVAATVLETALPGYLSSIRKGATKGVIMNTLKAAPIEGGTEGLQRFSQNLVANLSGISPDQALSEGVVDEALVGALFGSAIAGVSSIGANPNVIHPNEKKEEQKPQTNEFAKAVEMLQEPGKELGESKLVMKTGDALTRKLSDEEVASLDQKERAMLGIVLNLAQKQMTDPKKSAIVGSNIETIQASGVEIPGLKKFEDGAIAEGAAPVEASKPTAQADIQQKSVEKPVAAEKTATPVEKPVMKPVETVKQVKAPIAEKAPTYTVKDDKGNDVEFESVVPGVKQDGSAWFGKASKRAAESKEKQAPKEESADGYKVGEKVMFDGQARTITSILKKSQGEAKFELSDTDGKKIWANKGGLQESKDDVIKKALKSREERLRKEGWLDPAKETMSEKKPDKPKTLTYPESKEKLKNTKNRSEKKNPGTPKFGEFKKDPTYSDYEREASRLFMEKKLASVNDFDSELESDAVMFDELKGLKDRTIETMAEEAFDAKLDIAEYKIERVDGDNVVYIRLNTPNESLIANDTDFEFVSQKIDDVLVVYFRIVDRIDTEQMNVPAMFNRSTRGDDGKFTGSVPIAIENITEDQIAEKLKKDAELSRIANDILNEVNPLLRAGLQVKLMEEITDGIVSKDGKKFKTKGLYEASRAMVRVSKDLSKKEFVSTLIHEIRHHAFTFLPAKEQGMVVDWYKGLSEAERVDLFRSQKSAGEETANSIKGKMALFMSYQEEANKTENPDLFMADEAFNRLHDLETNKDISKIRKMTQDIIDALFRLLAKINNVIFKSKTIQSITRKRETLNLYKNIFEAKVGPFVRPDGYFFKLRNEPGLTGRSFSADVVTPSGNLSVSTTFNETWNKLFGVEPSGNLAKLVDSEAATIAEAMSRLSFSAGKEITTDKFRSKLRAKLWQQRKKFGREKDAIFLKVKNKEITRQNLRKALVQLTDDLPIQSRRKLLSQERVFNIKTRKSLAEVLDAIEVLKEKALIQRELSVMKGKVVAMIQEKRLQDTRNLRKAMGFPMLKEMNMEQLQEFLSVLESAHINDRFLSESKLKTLRHTELAGIKTYREALETLETRTGMKIADLKGVNQLITWTDKMRGDVLLAQKHPFLNVIVTDIDKELIAAAGRTIATSEQIDPLLRAARKSRGKTTGQKVWDFFAPTDDKIFEYIESENKGELAKEMTVQELKAAEFIIEDLKRKKDYLIKNQLMDKFIENYITHIRRGFLETVKEDGIREGFKNLIAGQKEEAQSFQIISDTGKILADEKFFRFAMHRSGGIKPTKNVGRAFVSYSRAFETKVALDSQIPKLSMWVNALTIDGKKTEAGLEIENKLKDLVFAYINNKKGRKATLLLPQGSREDIILRAAIKFYSTIRLGFSIPVGVGSTVGESVVNYVGLGAKKTALAMKRMASEQGRKIAAENRGFIGKKLVDQFTDQSTDGLDKVEEAAFVFFQASNLMSTRLWLFGEMTEAEFQSGKISKERLVEIKKNMGRWRVVPGFESVYGSTTLGAGWRQFRSWAIVISSSLVGNANYILRNYNNPKVLKSREFQETFRAFAMTSLVYMLITSSGDDDERGDDILSNLKWYARRELTTIYQAVDPTILAAVPAMGVYAGKMATIVKELVLLEKYSQSGEDYDRGDLKAIRKLIRLHTPGALKQFGD